MENFNFSLLVIIASILFVAFAIWQAFRHERKCRQKIQDLVESKGGQDVIVIKTEGGGQDHTVFLVRYKDQDRWEHRIRCKAEINLFGEVELYWDKNPIPDMTNHKEGMAEIRKSELDGIPLPKSFKEQIIDDLATENEQLRAVSNKQQ